MNNELGGVVVAGTVKYGGRRVRIEIGDPRQDNSTQDWQCTYRVGGGREHKPRGSDRLAAVYAARLDVEHTAARVDLPEGSNAAGQLRVPVVPGYSSVLRLRPTPASSVRRWGARAVHTASGPVVITIGRPRQDPNRPNTYPCSFRIDDRTEAFGQGSADIQVVMSAIRSVGAILGIPGNWPMPAI